MSNYYSSDWWITQRNLQIDLVCEAVHAAAAISNIPARAILSPCRSAEYVYPRSLAYYVSREFLHIPYLAIAEAMQRDHTTVLHGVRKIKAQMASDVVTRCDVEIMCERLKHLTDDTANSRPRQKRMMSR